jgi:hypothetical protein
LILLMELEPGKGRGKPVFLVVIGTGLAVMIFFAQFLPAYELIHNSIRSLGGIQVRITAREGMLGILGVIASMFYPIPIGAAENSTLKGMNWFYLGIVPMLGFLIAVRRIKPLRKLLWIFAAAGAYAIFSTNELLHHLIGWVPVLGQSVVPFRVFPALELVFLIMAGAGIDYFLNNKQRFYLPETYFSPTMAIALMLITLALLGPMKSGSFSIQIISWMIRFLSLMALLYLIVTSKNGGNRKLLLTLVFIDIYGWALIYFPRTDFEKYRLNPDLEQAVSFTDPKSRYLILGNSADPELPYSAGMMLKASTINGWTRTPLKRYAEVLALVFPGIMQKQNGKLTFYDQMASNNLDQTPEKDAYLLNLLNVKWVISRVEIPFARQKFGFEETRGKQLYIYINPQVMDRAFLVGREKVLSSESEVMGAMASGDFDYKSLILFSKSTFKGDEKPLSETGMVGSLGNVILDRRSPSSISAEVDAREMAWLFMSETFAPGWKAYIDGKNGKELRILPADHAFQAILLPKGGHKISFFYKPASFRIGLFASVGAIASIIFILAAPMKNRKK